HLGLKAEEIPALIARLQENLPYQVAAGGLLVEGEDLEVLLKEADKRMYRAKRARKGL
ncbi:GGDEF domain-containing protein, partial [Thermus scotoductus]